MAGLNLSGLTNQSLKSMLCDKGIKQLDLSESSLSELSLYCTFSNLPESTLETLNLSKNTIKITML